MQTTQCPRCRHTFLSYAAECPECALKAPRRTSRIWGPIAALLTSGLALTATVLMVRNAMRTDDEVALGKKPSTSAAARFVQPGPAVAQAAAQRR